MSQSFAVREVVKERFCIRSACFSELRVQRYEEFLNLPNKTDDEHVIFFVIYILYIYI